VIVEATALDVTQYTDEYEQLRAQVIGAGLTDAPRPDPAGSPRGVGLALMLREGMPGWLRAIDAVIRASTPSRTVESRPAPVPEQAAPCSITPSWLSVVPRQNLTTLLTSLVLSTHRVERSSPKEGYRSW
jgi:hypothetical protein